MTALILLSEFQKTEIELWRPVEGFPDYDVSNLGRVRSWRMRVAIPGKRGSASARRTEPYVLALGVKETGRLHVVLRQGGRHLTVQVHLLVGRTFLPNPDNLPELNHKTGIHTDNRLGNLEWVTSAQNIQHAVKFGLVAHGTRHGMSKLNPAQVYEIRKRCDGGESQRCVAVSLGLAQGTVADVARRASWKRLPEM
jgi:hypothetical protein